MGLGTFATYIIVMLFLAGVYATYSKRGKIFCQYNGEDDTTEFKWIKITDTKVNFRGKRFQVLPERIKSVWVKSGIHFFFPTRANFLEFSWFSEYPHDSHNYNLTGVSPSVRASFDKEGWVKSYAKNFAPQNQKKASGLMAYLPLITLIVVIIAGYWLYQNVQVQGAHINAIQQSLNAIKK